MTLPDILLLILFLLLISGFAAFALTAWREKHHRAARLAGALALASLILSVLLLLAPPLVQQLALGAAGLGLLSMGIAFFLPIGEEAAPSPPPRGRVDERTIPFSRVRLQPNTPNYASYYADHPDHQQPDDAFRANPGLLAPGAVFYDPTLAAAAESSFFLTESLRNAVDGPVAPHLIHQDPAAISRSLKDLARYHGALEAGICRLQPTHLYSHIGRGTGGYGDPVTLDHTFALAFTVEMDHAMINTAPRSPTVIESARQYANAAKIAIILAAFIRRLGYPARAHIDGNYRVIAPLVAKEAGLGEIGRMGLLMTPQQGPRVRLGVVTTTLPLLPDAPTHNPAVLDFCTICKKCAVVCPSQAIPFEDRTTHPDGTLRWQINAERCFTYWTQIGTDCGRCMAVCPYAHAGGPLHDLIRWGAARSGAFRRAVHWMDNAFYGKKPPPHPAPDWVDRLKKNRN